MLPHLPGSLLDFSRGFAKSEGRGGRFRGIEPGPQASDGERMNLGDTRLADPQRGGDCFHGEFFIIVECENSLLFFRQFGNGLLQQMLHLGAEALEERRFLGLGWNAVGKIFFFAVAGRLDPQAAEFEAVEFGNQGLQFVQVDAHLMGDFIFVGRASELAGKVAVDGIDEAAFPTQFARAPVKFAKAVDDGAANAKLGLTTELHLLGQIELVEGVDESDDACMDQVLEGHVAGQPLVNAAGDVADLGKLFQEDALAFGGFVNSLMAFRRMFGHEVACFR
jgi:hypothetical protein